MDFETLYRRYAPDVYRFALFLCGRPDQADDIAAETFVRAWTSPEPLADMVDRGASGPEDASIARIDLDRVLVHLQQLPEIDRAVLLMRAESGMSYEEIAAALAISIGAAKVKAHRARARLAEMQRQEEP
jgi:RNA polymerase sigma-70 factor, ECF subfamily